MRLGLVQQYQSELIYWRSFSGLDRRLKIKTPVCSDDIRSVRIIAVFPRGVSHMAFQGGECPEKQTTRKENPQHCSESLQAYETCSKHYTKFQFHDVSGTQPVFELECELN